MNQRGTILAEASFNPTLPEEIRAAANAIEKQLRQEPLNPPSRSDLAVDSPSRRALSFLIRSGVATELAEKVVILTEAYEEAGIKVLTFIKFERSGYRQRTSPGTRHQSSNHHAPLGTHGLRKERPDAMVISGLRLNPRIPLMRTHADVTAWRGISKAPPD